MSAIKKFSVFCGGFTVFTAVMYLFSQFMAYNPKVEEEISILEKVKMFFSTAPSKDYYLYIPLLILLALTLILSLIFRKHPQFPFAASVFPLLWSLLLFESERLYERPWLYFIFCSLQAMCLLYECIRLDREEGTRRAAFATDLLGILGALLCLFLIFRAGMLVDAEYADLRFFDVKIYRAMEGADTAIFYRPAIALAVTVILRLVLRDLYFLDALLAVVPAVYTVWLWYTDKLPYHGILPAAVTVAYAVARIAVMLSCKPKKTSIPTQD